MPMAMLKLKLWECRLAEPWKATITILRFLLIHTES